MQNVLTVISLITFLLPPHPHIEQSKFIKHPPLYSPLSETVSPVLNESRATTLNFLAYIYNKV